MKKIILLLITVFLLLSIIQYAGAFDPPLSGTLKKGTCKKDFSVNGVTVFFGPYRYIRSTIALFDYDGDGDDTETIYKELIGLVGEEVTLEGWYKDTDFFNVFTINGLLYRETGPPPWT